MSPGQVSWRDRFGEEITCLRCLEVRDAAEMDRLLWCRDCRLQARTRAARRGWLVGAVATGLLAAWIWVAVEPSSLVPGGWLATLVAAAWILSKVARELFFGWERFRNRKALEARPPSPGGARGGD